MNLTDCWLTASLLSLAESHPYPAERNHPFFPMLNLEKTRLLPAAVVESSAAEYKTARIDQSTLTRCLNHLVDATNSSALTEELTSYSGTDEVRVRFKSFLAGMGNTQLRLQDFQPWQIGGRLIGLINSLPRQRAAEDDARGAELADSSRLVEKQLGSSVSDLWLIHIGIFGLLQKRFETQLWPSLQSLRSHSLESHRHTQSRLIGHLVALRERFGPALVLPEHSPVFAASLGTDEGAYAAHLRLCSASTKELRQLRNSTPEVDKGNVASPFRLPLPARRLSPLDRYPVVRLSGEYRGFVVPDLRSYLRSFPDIVHYTLWETMGSAYTTFLGRAVEVYLEQLVRSQLPDVVVIPERKYRLGHDELRGPDLTIVDGDRLIVIEAKARQFSAATRLMATPERVRENLGDLLGQVARLPRKVEHLYQGLPVYAEEQVAINRTRDRLPILVGTTPGEFFFLGELVRMMASAGLLPEMAALREPYVVVGLTELERAVDTAAQSSKRLSTLLQEHHDGADRTEFVHESADRFGSYELEPTRCFAYRFV